MPNRMHKKTNNAYFFIVKRKTYFFFFFFGNDGVPTIVRCAGKAAEGDTYRP